MQPSIAPIFSPIWSPKRYKILHGGRGSGKSWAVARVLVVLAARKRVRILCAREYQKSIADSVHKLLVDQIEAQGLTALFDVTKTSIKCLTTGSEFIFEGLKANVTKIKSMEGIDICWVEEAEKVSKESWNVLIPTIRKKGSEIWVTFNPDQERDPTFDRFVKNPPPNAIVLQVNYNDNPHFPAELRAEMEYLRSVDLDAYLHVWEGQCRISSKAQVLHGKWEIGAFEPPAGAQFMFGADWGFAQDPTTLIRSWVDGPDLYIDHEIYRVGLELDDTADAFKTVPGADQYVIRADCARPETIAHVAKKLPKIIAAPKWDGSIKDGITCLRGFRRIYIHERCKNVIKEAQLYSYKVNKLTNDVLPEIDDKHNHCWDAVRYALAPLIKLSGPGAGFLNFIASQAAEQAEKAKQ